MLYRAGGLLQWKTVSLNVVMKENDIIGCGYKKDEDHSDKGLAYFTYNGQRLAENLDGVQSGLWPVIHIQKKVKITSLSCAHEILVKEQRIGKL